KSHKAKRFKSLTWVRKSIKRMVGLTGTPAPNGLLDLWSQVYLLDEGQRLGKRITHYRERYFDPDARDRDHVFSYAPKPGADEAIHRLIGDICISMSAKDYLQLPDLVEDIVPVALDSKAAKAYEEFEKNLLVEIDDELLDAGSAAVLSGKLLQMANGAVYNEDKQPVE
ncbi:SNF2-related protein, partial [Anaerovorax odorimutans]